MFVLEGGHYQLPLPLDLLSQGRYKLFLWGGNFLLLYQLFKFELFTELCLLVCLIVATQHNMNPITQPVESKTQKYHGRVWAGRRTVGRDEATRGGAGRDIDGSSRPGNDCPSCPPRHREQLS